jgi:hypothetical protein
MFSWVAGYMLGQKAATRAASMSVVSNNILGQAAAPPHADQRVDRLLVVVEAMWDLLKQHGHTDDELQGRIEDLIEARTVRTAIPCPSCGSRVSADLPRCQICGTETGGGPVGPLGGM